MVPKALDHSQLNMLKVGAGIAAAMPERIDFLAILF